MKGVKTMTKEDMIEAIKENLSSLEYNDLLERAQTFAELFLNTLTDEEVKIEYDCEFDGADDDEDDEFAALESAILKAKGQDLLNETRTMWEAEHQEEEYQEGSLDFKHIKEGYQRRPSTPEVFTKNDENKIYKRVVEKAQAKPNKLQEADILASPYARQDVSDMSGWRDLVETHVNDEEIRERLGAGAVASALLAEANDEEVSKGLKRMKEIVSPQAQEKGADASDIAAMAARGAFNESLSDEISPARIKASMQENVNNGEDLTALVLGDTRELADVK